jgi:ferredoxin
MTETDIRVEVHGCIGSGLCMAVAPDHFRFVGARAESSQGVVSGDDVELVRAAAGICPAGAISVGAPQTY